MHDLTTQQIRQLIDCEQLYATYRDTRRELAERFSGAMSWKTVKEKTYLYRKTGDIWKSLGVEDDRTRAIHAGFHDGRTALRSRHKNLDDRIREMAPVNRAMRLGRVPGMSAKLIRRFEREGMLGNGLKIVGTHALYAYERLGGVHFGNAAIATMDIDQLYDSRASLKLMSPDLKQNGLIGVLQSQDKSFRPTQANSFRAVNDDGFMVDLITASMRMPAMRRSKSRLGARADDLMAAEIDGLAWLENVPTLVQTVISDRGFPLTMVVPDVRAFMCHKAWIAKRDDRESLKKRRDVVQAHTLARMLVTRLPTLRLDDPALKAVPTSVLDLGRQLVEGLETQHGGLYSEEWDE